MLTTIKFKALFFFERIWHVLNLYLEKQSKTSEYFSSSDSKWHKAMFSFLLLHCFLFFFTFIYLTSIMKRRWVKSDILPFNPIVYAGKIQFSNFVIALTKQANIFESFFSDNPSSEMECFLFHPFISKDVFCCCCFFTFVLHLRSACNLTPFFDSIFNLFNQRKKIINFTDK